jgi:hypothetical protein
MCSKFFFFLCKRQPVSPLHPRWPKPPGILAEAATKLAETQLKTEAATRTAETATTMKWALTSCICPIEGKNEKNTHPDTIFSKVSAGEMSSCQPEKGHAVTKINDGKVSETFYWKQLHINVEKPT